MGRKEEEESDSESEVEDPIIISRAEWGARNPVDVQPMPGPVTDVVYTETDTRECHDREDCKRLIKQMQNYSIDVRGIPDIPHHFLIGGDGYVYEGRGWNTKGQNYSPSVNLPPKMANRSIEVAFIGLYKEKDPTKKMIKASEALIKYGMSNKKIHLQEKIPENKNNTVDKEEAKDKDKKKKVEAIQRDEKRRA